MGLPVWRASEICFTTEYTFGAEATLQDRRRVDRRACADSASQETVGTRTRYRLPLPKSRSLEVVEDRRKKGDGVREFESLRRP